MTPDKAVIFFSRHKKSRFPNWRIDLKKSHLTKALVEEENQHSSLTEPIFKHSHFILILFQSA
jgi:hypothetical protein